MLEQKIIKLSNKAYLKIVSICLKRLNKKSAKALREYESNIMTAARIKDAAKLAEQRSKVVADMAIDTYASKEVAIDEEQIVAKSVLANHTL